MNRLIMLFMMVMLASSCGSVPKSDAKCLSGFRNGSVVLTDAELSLAWHRAQLIIANGQWVINALSCGRADDPPPCEYHAADARALSLTPDCVSAKGVHGLIDGKYTGQQDGNAIVIDVDYPHEQVLNLAQWEFENCMGQRLGFDMGDR